MQASHPGRLLAVGVGPRSGVALFAADGQLLSYHSQSLYSPAQLRRAASRVLQGAGALDWLISCGDLSQAAIWERAAMRQGVRVQRVDRLIWRAGQLAASAGMPPSGALRAQRAQTLARQVIVAAGGPVPVVLPANVATAILIGLWGVMQLGWLPQPPWQGRPAPLPTTAAVAP